MKLSEGMCPDGRVFDTPTDVKPMDEQDLINWLRSENAYLRGKIEVYEKFLKDKGYIKEEECEAEEEE